jgi:hypothetical protein
MDEMYGLIAGRVNGLKQKWESGMNRAADFSSLVEPANIESIRRHGVNTEALGLGRGIVRPAPPAGQIRVRARDGTLGTIPTGQWGPKAQEQGYTRVD